MPPTMAVDIPSPSAALAALEDSVLSPASPALSSGRLSTGGAYVGQTQRAVETALREARRLREKVVGGDKLAAEDDAAALAHIEHALQRVMLGAAMVTLGGPATTPKTPKDTSFVPDALLSASLKEGREGSPNAAGDGGLVRYLSREFTQTGHFAAAEGLKRLNVSAVALSALRLKKLAQKARSNLSKELSEASGAERAGAAAGEGGDATARLGLTGEAASRCRAALARHESWDDFDPFELEAAAGGRRNALLVLAWHVLVDVWDFTSTIPGLANSEKRLWTFLRKVKDGYEDILYHNALHAADVLQSVHWMLLPSKVGGGGAGELLSPLERFSMLLAATCNDLGHDGFNNLFHVNSMSQRAIDHNDISVHENEHCSRMFRIVNETDGSCNFLADMEVSDRKLVRSTVIELILGTDMTNHFVHLEEFKELLATNGPLFFADGLSNVGAWADHTKPAMRMLLHACDISNPCKPWAQSVRWGRMCVDEFFAQGDAERDHGLPVSPMCDRNDTVFWKCQLGFINFIVKPTFVVMADFIPHLKDVHLKHVDANVGLYQAMGEARDNAPEVSRVE